VWTSEKVKSISVGSFVVSRGGVSSPVAGVDSVRASDASGRAWTVFLKSGAFKAGDSLRLLSTSTVTDMAGNSPSDCPTMGRNVSLIGRAAPFAKAWVLDSDGDGFADQVKMVYRKVVAASDLPDSIEVTFGDVATVRTAAVSGLQVIDSTVTVALPIPFGWGQTRESRPMVREPSRCGRAEPAVRLRVCPTAWARCSWLRRCGSRVWETRTPWYCRSPNRLDLPSEPVGSPIRPARTWRIAANFCLVHQLALPDSRFHGVAGDSVKPLATSRWSISLRDATHRSGIRGLPSSVASAHLCSDGTPTKTATRRSITSTSNS
jgi:hypothetical protein